MQLLNVFNSQARVLLEIAYELVTEHWVYSLRSWWRMGEGGGEVCEDRFNSL